MSFFIIHVCINRFYTSALWIIVNEVFLSNHFVDVVVIKSFIFWEEKIFHLFVSLYCRNLFHTFLITERITKMSLIKHSDNCVIGKLK